MEDVSGEEAIRLQNSRILLMEEKSSLALQLIDIIQKQITAQTEGELKVSKEITLENTSGKGYRASFNTLSIISTKISVKTAIRRRLVKSCCYDEEHEKGGDNSIS